MRISFRCPEDAAVLTRLIRQSTDAKQRDRYRTIELAVAGHQTLDPVDAPPFTRLRATLVLHLSRPRAEGGPAQAPAGQAPDAAERSARGVQATRTRRATPEDGRCVLRGEDCRRILREEFGVSYELRGVYALLHRLNLSVLAPRPRFRRHRKSDPEAQQQ